MVGCIGDIEGFPSDSVVKNPSANAGDEKSHGQRSLASYSPWRLQRVRHNRVTEYYRGYWDLVLLPSSELTLSLHYVACVCVCVSHTVISDSLWPMDCSSPGSSVHGIFQATILEWIAIPVSRASSWARDWTWVFRVAGKVFAIWATREAPYVAYHLKKEFNFHFWLCLVFVAAWALL